jgi:GNAT superfamily N-acetyltransferase
MLLEDFFMHLFKKNILDQTILDDFVFNLKFNKYKNKILDLKLEDCTDGENVHYIYLGLINIVKSQRNKGYGTAIMYEITNLANIYNVQIRLWVTDLYGSDFKRLIMFYKNHGFTLMKDKMNTQMKYIPKKIRKIKKK